MSASVESTLHKYTAPELNLFQCFLGGMQYVIYRQPGLHGNWERSLGMNRNLTTLHEKSLFVLKNMATVLYTLVT